MAQQTINVGTTANDGTGDGLRAAFQKINANETELYTAVAAKADDAATTAALTSKAPLASPSFTGTPTAPTAVATTNTTQIATTAMVQAALAAYGTVTGPTSATDARIAVFDGATGKLIKDSGSTIADLTGGTTDIANAIHSATGKTTPVDADELALVDSAASNVLKKLTWANLKATLKTYLDTLYVAIPGAWTAYTPTVTAGTGTFTTVSATGRWQKIGKTVVGSVKVTITTNGTAAGYVRCTTPIAVRDNYSCLGRETAVNGNFLFCNAQSGGDFIIMLAAGTYPGADGAVLEFTFTYETT